jgi:hypothetical protein
MTYYELVEGLYYYLFYAHTLSKKPVNERHLVMFLIRKTPSDRIPVIFNKAECMNIISRIPGTDTYIPVMRPDPETFLRATLTL